MRYGDGRLRNQYCHSELVQMTRSLTAHAPHLFGALRPPTLRATGPCPPGHCIVRFPPRTVMASLTPDAPSGPRMRRICKLLLGRLANQEVRSSGEVLRHARRMWTRTRGSGAIFWCEARRCCPIPWHRANISRPTFEARIRERLHFVQVRLWRWICFIKSRAQPGKSARAIPTSMPAPTSATKQVGFVQIQARSAYFRSDVRAASRSGLLDGQCAMHLPNLEPQSRPPTCPRPCHDMLRLACTAWLGANSTLATVVVAPALERVPGSSS